MTRESGTPGIDLKLPVPGGATVIWIGHRGASQLGGKSGLINRVSHSIVNGQQMNLAITVRSSGTNPGIIVQADGKKLIDWKGDYRTDLGPIKSTYPSKRLGLWIYGTKKDTYTKFRFHRILFRPLSK